jgi:hypothetical protein
MSLGSKFENFEGAVIGVGINAQELEQLAQALESMGDNAIVELIDPFMSRVAHEAYLSFMLRMHKGDPKVDKHSGRMRAMTHEERVSEGIYRTVTTATSDQGYPYPFKENARLGDKKGYGPHSFIPPTIMSVNQLVPELISEFGNWVRSRISGGAGAPPFTGGGSVGGAPF